MKFKIITSFWNWIRSKFHNGYQQPTMEEIETFLTENFRLPTYSNNEKVHYFKTNELHKLIDERFNFSCDKIITKAVWHKLNYTVVKRRQYHHSMEYKAIPLVLIIKNVK